MGKLKGAFASMMDVKPILTIENGEVSLFKKSRKWEQAKDTIVSTVKQKVGGSRDVVISVGDVDSEAEADNLSQRLMDEIGPKEIIRTEIGIVVGSHLGIGGLGITFHY
jgi:fatty acid-binding protein DegV